jgi:quercetin 2,3-dioxygenase
MGLQTVSWLLAGEIEHRDSLGSHAFVHPGELNLMTAGHGISHSEYATDAAGLRGIQMWIALPQSLRHRPPAFKQHTDLPTVEIAAGDSAALATVFIGSSGSDTSAPARTHHTSLTRRSRPSLPDTTVTT